jgi:putative peptidoglycan lipid II flippase
VRQTIPALYAMGDTRTPVIVSVLDLMAFIGLALGLRASLGHAGISAAVAGSSAVQMLLLLVGLRWRLGTICGQTLVSSAMRTLAASLVAGLAGVGTVRLLSPCVGCSPSLRALPGVGAMVVYGVVFLGTAWALRAPEFLEIARAVLRHGRRGR